MTNRNESYSQVYAWLKVVFSVPVGILAIWLLAGAAEWWEFATAFIATALAVTLLTVGLRDVTARKRRRNAVVDGK
ncbi:hypothetical protein I6E74_02300 [Salinibacterium sp. SWN139]|uniref:hypothetical protein n=1 Tax=Salinibacterium sp. SWN139 TaxID=2792055 RepID=UPI0018CE3DAB|nr:hypothetical protein [Salinibacterium sp. SWN139]MBH0052999.1 hypothetical protein [Salinibacterium sp. SWN139]